MVKFNTFSAALLLSSLSTLTVAHPEHHEMEEALQKRNAHAANIQRSLAKCARDPRYLALQERAIQRRWEKVQRLRQERGISNESPIRSSIKRRDLAALEKDEAVNHNMTSYGYTETTPSSELFASYKNASCILTPEVTEGPYYVTGEYFRSNVTAGQAGVPIHLEYQYIDIETCAAATGLYIETW